jgi:hypothetical protein
MRKMRIFQNLHNAETAGNELTNDALVDLFLSSLGTDNTTYYSIFHTTLENQCADDQNISFADMELKFIQLEEWHTSSASSHHERANLVALNANHWLLPIIIMVKPSHGTT